MLCGLLLLDKPVGLSSNAAMQRVRRLYGGVKAGHTGSLDPLASGMLPICLGEATKLAGEVLVGDKAYRFRLQLGSRTATGDAEGEVVDRRPVPELTPAMIEAALAGRRGESLQVPPMYSALKHQGRPLYRLARQGASVEREPRRILVRRLELLERGPEWLDVAVLCSKGTYVRVLGEDLAAALGTAGHLSALRRDYVEPFQDRPMVSLTTLETLPEAERLAWVLPADAAVPQYHAVALDAAAATRLRHGQAVRTDASGTSGRVRLYDASGVFMGLGERDAAGILRVRRLFAAANPGT